MRDLESCEKKIATMEARIKELDTLFMKPENASKMELVTEYTDTKRALDEENERWFKLSEDLETLKAE
jgi:ATP-binding cassette subfamily F protein 3